MLLALLSLDAGRAGGALSKEPNPPAAPSEALLWTGPGRPGLAGGGARLPDEALLPKAGDGVLVFRGGPVGGALMDGGGAMAEAPAGGGGVPRGGGGVADFATVSSAPAFLLTQRLSSGS